MAPFSSFASYHWTLGPAKLERFNGVGSLELQGTPAPGQSSGTAMDEVQKLFGQLPKGVGLEWTGLSYQERQAGAQTYALYSISVLVVFLLLAALYESWSIPLSVMLVIPLASSARSWQRRCAGLQRHLFPSGPADHDGPVGEERDPDRRVRRRCAEARQIYPRRRGGSRAPQAASDPDDLTRLHRRA